MKNFIKSAQSHIAAKLADVDFAEVVKAEKVERILLSSLLVVTVSAGIPTNNATAANNQPFAKALGASLGALAGAKLSKNRPYSERAAIGMATGAAGAWIADSALSNDDGTTGNQHSARRTQSVNHWRSRTLPTRNYNTYPSHQDNLRSNLRGPELISPIDFDMPEILVDALRKSGNLGMIRGEGSKPLNESSFQRLSETTRSLSRSGQIYAEAKQAWDEAQIKTGVEGVDSRTKTAETLNGASKIVQARAQDWLNVRNALAIQGVNVSSFDNAIRSDLGRVELASKYDYKLNTNYRPR